METEAIDIETVPTLPELARSIEHEHAAALAAVRQWIQHARRAGELLIRVRDQLPHGQWLPWLRAYCSFSARTAQGYMRLAERWPELEAKAQHVADLTLREALALLAKPRPSLLDEPKEEPQMAFSFEPGAVDTPRSPSLLCGVPWCVALHDGSGECAAHIFRLTPN